MTAKPIADPTWIRGDWMQLYSGNRFFPMDPQADDIRSEDIAHALSLLCRYGGHVNRFYSVAEHCVLMSQAVEPRHALQALLHDATEAYVVDVPRPIKQYLPDYQNIEESVWYAIADYFCINDELSQQVHDADNRILLTERNALMKRISHAWSVENLVPLPVEIHAWAPEVAEQQYLTRLEELTNGR